MYCPCAPEMGNPFWMQPAQTQKILPIERARQLSALEVNPVYDGILKALLRLPVPVAWCDQDIRPHSETPSTAAFQQTCSTRLKRTTVDRGAGHCMGE